MAANTEGPFRSVEGGVEIDVWVVPGARRSELAGLHGGAIRVRIAAPPEKGKANAATRRLLSERLGVAVELVAGTSHRRKRFRALGLSAEDAARTLGV